MKDYGEASCLGASAEPVKDTDMSEPLPEFETRIKEREFNSLISVCNNVIWNFVGSIQRILYRIP